MYVAVGSEFVQAIVKLYAVNAQLIAHTNPIGYAAVRNAFSKLFMIKEMRN